MNKNVAKQENMKDGLEGYIMEIFLSIKLL